MEQLLGMAWDGTGIVLQIALLVGLFLWNAVKEPLKTAISAHTTANQRQVLSQLGREAFAYAETVHAAQDGPAKMNEAVKFLLDRCESCGLKDLQMVEVRAAIESAWLQDRRQSGRPTAMVVSSSMTEQR